MPIEIRELVIRAEVDASAQAGSSAAAGGSEKQALIQECVEEVLRKLKQRKER